MSPAEPRLVSSAGSYPLDAPIWRGAGGELLDIEFTPRLDPAAVARRPATLWRYREALPLAAEAIPVSLGEPLTPLLQLDFGGRPVWIKQEQLFPTGSYKDRGAALLVSQARAIGVGAVVEDSSGNAGCAIAAYCGRAGIDCTIFVPADTSPDKLTQIEAYGATLRLVEGSREDTAAAVLAAAESTYYASHTWNPFFFHGTKTFAYELVEQLGWRAPDAVVLPAGNGTLLLGADIGFRELHAMGLIHRLPQLIAVQAAHCAPLAAAFAAGSHRPVAVPTRPTLAEGVAIAAPLRGRQILAAVRRSGGRFVTVTEEAIAAAWREMAGRGFYIEPTSAATIAGLRQWLAAGDAPDLVVSLFSGHGLKTGVKARKLLASTAATG